MFLLGVILRLQKSCCLYSEKRVGGGGVGWLEVGGWLCPNRFVKRSDCFGPTCAQKMTDLGKATTTLRSQILYGEKTTFLHFSCFALCNGIVDFGLFGLCELRLQSLIEKVKQETKKNFISYVL